MSDAEKPDLSALAELEEVATRITEELAGWRKRALAAEQAKAGHGTKDVVSGRERIVALEGDNGELVKRLDAATERLRAMLARLAFLEEQASLEDNAR
jgi:hypothetical protein